MYLTSGNNKGVDNFVKVGGLGCKCEVRERDHVQSMRNMEC